MERTFVQFYPTLLPIAKAKRTFKEEIGGVEYRPLLPSEQKPPIDLNRAAMDKYRPLMEKHYLVGKPVFT